ncbi:DUF1127 domain-containing protein [Limoniibacter endophyticus]|uniref:DUF1127 domain-containing protein n=1 Tax=Limoniibacter endophyticus TaxID=1565040 RepID=UPI001673BFC5|nr:DUF1127 domain-containing protein [Limoniibacter endophyticus]
MSTIDTISSGPVPTRRGIVSAPSRLIIRTLITVSDWVSNCAERRRSRRALAALSDEHLRDIGLSRADAANEANVPFWRSSR